MKISIVKNESAKGNLAIVGVFEKENVEKTFQPFLKTLQKINHFSASIETCDFVYPENFKFKKILFVGLGDKKTFDLKKLEKTIKHISSVLKKSKNEKCFLFLKSFENKNLNIEMLLKHSSIFLNDSFYCFDFYKSEKNKNQNFEIFFPLTVEKQDFQNILKESEAINEGINLAKNLGNQPANVCTPEFLVQTAKEIAQNKNVTFNVLDEKNLKKEGFGALLSVAQGSDKKPYLIHLEYGKKFGKPIVLVGKGVCFDSGGISLKPSAGMDEMKFDMCGAASVLGTFLSVCLLQLPIHLHVLVPTVENMPSGKATRPGDVVESLSKQTIEIVNTDAEGRLILCDSLTFAQTLKPKYIIDVATLTGACVVALGGVLSGLFSNNALLEKKLLTAGKNSADLLWSMPLMEEYQQLLESPIADMSNSGGREAGAISAACFLSRFVQNSAWAHLDIAGTAWLSGKNKTATGRPVKALFEFLKNESIFK